MNTTDAIGHISHATFHWRRLPAAVVAAVATWARLGRERDQLLAMGQRDLSDLGVSRIDALQAAYQPRWSRVAQAFRDELGDAS